MANLTYIMPCFIIADLKISVSFYVDKLGFEVRYIGPDDNPYWAIVGRDNISIRLNAVAQGIKPISNHTRHEWAPSHAYISARVSHLGRLSQPSYYPYFLKLVELLRESAVYVGPEFFCNFQNRI